MSWHKAGMAAAWFCVLVGTGIGSLWLLKSGHVADTLPILFRMQFNTAINFVLTGLAVTALLSGAGRIATGLSIAVMLIGLAFLLEPLFHAGHPLDTLLIDPFRQTSPHPGHLASGTALSFLLIGVCVLVSAVTGRPTLLRVVLAAVVFMAAAATLIGYGLQLITESDWPRYGHMSPHTALCFAALALPLIFLRVEELDYNASTIAAMLGAASYLLLLALTLLDLQNAFEGSSPTVSIDPDGKPASQAILAGLLVVSGIVYAGLIVYAFRSAQRSRVIALQLRESQERMSAIIDTAADGIVTIDARGTILSTNRAMETIFGYRSEDMLGRDVRTLIPDLIPTAGNDDHTADIACATREVEGTRRSGIRFPLDLSVARIELDHTVLYSGIIRDISQRKQHEQEILDVNAELEEFAWRTSHDLRAPIASSIGLTAIMRDMIGLQAPTTQLVPVIGRLERGLQKLDGLIENIIQLKRSRLLDEATTSVPLASTVQETIERLRFIDPGRQVSLAVDIPETLVIQTKPARLRMILDNLISNAIKYADPDEEERRVIVDAALTGNGWLELRVSDNGLGLGQGDENGLFQMFKRFHPSRSDGSGLGLYIVKTTVEHLGGTVAYVRLDKGSRFVIRLPQRNDA
ncbi:PAS domain S-box protein [Rhizobiaceae bacterium CRRU44]|uniref:histidine kinase n=1 Tax=Ferranicluibacter rubi TaxID=2715133 RepID=A0AA43ZIB7_9HYPH|nr:PAS domain-containing sensor histidine kinase [Ferranicluibacter rubi]NHT78414.1 PAS domain S-box protein [Ferranicluibacter rubi]